MTRKEIKEVNGVLRFYGVKTSYPEAIKTMKVAQKVAAVVRPLGKKRGAAVLGAVQILSEACDTRPILKSRPSLRKRVSKSN